MADDELANALYCAVVQPELTWWDDLTPEMQEAWRRAATVARGPGLRAVLEAADSVDSLWYDHSHYWTYDSVHFEKALLALRKALGELDKSSVPKHAYPGTEGTDDETVTTDT